MAKAEKFNINQASREDLMQVEGISSTTADFIYRFLQENCTAGKPGRLKKN